MNNYIYRIKKNFDGDVMDKYVWGKVLYESKYVEKEEEFPLEPDYFHKDYYMRIKIMTGKHWGDFVFIGIDILLKKTLHEKLVENGFIHGYKTYKVINTVKGGPEYVGIVVTEDSIELPKENLIYMQESWGLSAEDFIGIEGMERGNDFFSVPEVGGKYITEKLYNFLQENADVGNVEFKQIECR